MGGGTGQRQRLRDGLRQAPIEVRADPRRDQLDPHFGQRGVIAQQCLVDRDRLPPLLPALQLEGFCQLPVDGRQGFLVGDLRPRSGNDRAARPDRFRLGKRRPGAVEITLLEGLESPAHVPSEALIDQFGFNLGQ